MIYFGAIDDFVKTITEIKDESDKETGRAVSGISKRGVSYAEGFEKEREEAREASVVRPKLTSQVSFSMDEQTKPTLAPPKTAPSATFDQNSALDNWQRKMAERKKIHGRISKLVSRP